MLPSLEEGGVEGMTKFLAGITNELRFVMSCTGAAHVCDIDGRFLVKTSF